MNASAHRQHVLLVGIDAYRKVDPLHGCVNDVDALEAVFLDRLQVDPSAITKLVAVHPGALRSSRVREDEPTATNLRQALEKLGSELVCPGDRVYIHYSGHGTQVFSRITHTVREALVPVDAHAGGELLFDDEINALLRRIAQRTNDLTVVIDGCCSAGATRSVFGPADRAVRFCHVESSMTEPPRVRSGRADVSMGLVSSLDPSDPGFLVIASAQSREAAHEGRNAHGVRHGAFVGALLDLLAREPTENLSKLRWVDIWPALCARMETAFPGQHPCLIGRRERRVFGGPFRQQDPGFPLSESGGVHHIQAGSLVGLSAGAQVAVYGEEPALFPPLHSSADIAARRGILHVERVTLGSAVAHSGGVAIPLDRGARGRLVCPGVDDKLVVVLDPFDAKMARYLEREVPVMVLPAADRGARIVEAFIGSSADGSWWVGDDVFGAEEPLVRVPRENVAGLAEVLWHFLRYCLPLRLVRRCRDAGELLRLRVLDARHVDKIDVAGMHDPALPEVEADGEGRYRHRLTDGQPVCFCVENRYSRPLYTHMINCASSGKVEILGPTQLEVPFQRRQTFWQGGLMGKPFPCSLSPGRTSNVERVIVVGTSLPGVDLQYLRVQQSFSDALRLAKRDASSRGVTHDVWTATMALVRIERG